MSKCPFGYKAEEPASDEEEDTVEEEEEKVTDEANDKAGGEGEIDDPDIISFENKGKKKASTGKVSTPAFRKPMIYDTSSNVMHGFHASMLHGVAYYCWPSLNPQGMV